LKLGTAFHALYTLPTCATLQVTISRVYQTFQEYFNYESEKIYRLVDKRLIYVIDTNIKQYF